MKRGKVAHFVVERERKICFFGSLEQFTTKIVVQIQFPEYQEVQF